MAVNTLETRFVFDDKDGIKVDNIHKKLTDANNNINTLGKDSLFGKNIADSIKPAETALDSFNKKLTDSTIKPTISRYWEAEETRTIGSLKAIENAAIKTNNSLSNIGSTSLKSKSNFIEPSNKIPQPEIKFAVDDKDFIDLDKLQKKADDTRKSFADISAQKLNSGNIGVLSKEIVTAHERSKQLVGDIKNIKTELSNPNRKSSIKFLTDELQAAEKEADRLNKKLSALPNTQNPTSTSKAISSGRRGGITNAQATFLEFADDFAPEGLNRAFNAAGRAVFAAQNIKEAGKEMAVLSGLSITTLATFGAIAAAGFVIVDASSKIREQAEKRLLNEQLISGAINKQIIGLRDAYAEYEKFKRSLEKDESFSNRLTSAVNTSDASAIKREREKIDTDNKSRIEEINRLQANLAQKERSLEFAKNRNVNQNLFTMLGAPDPISQGLLTTLGIGRGYTASDKQQDVSQAERAAEKTRKALAETETALEKGKSILQQTDRALIDIRERQNKAFSNRFETFQKSQQDSLKFEMRQFDELEKKKKKIAETKILKAEFNTFSAESTFPNNPFIKLFADGDSAGERMQKRFKTLGDEYVKLATVIERNSIAKKINELKFSNDLSALKITQDVRRIEQLPNNQRFESVRGLENLNQISDFALNFNNLSRKLAEANFYSDKYNPNNPKSFAEYNRRGIKDDISETGLQIRYAVEDIRKLNSIDLQGTSVYGQGAIADKILSVIPSRDDLLKRLNNPLTRNDAQYLLNQQSISLRNKRDFETQKFDDFFEQQKYGDLRRTDAREQLDLLKNSTGLDKEFANQQFLKITDELGTQNLDRGLLQGRRDAQLEAVKLLQEQFRNAQKEAAETKVRNQKLETFLEKITDLLSANGLKIDASNMPETVVNVTAKDFDYYEDKRPNDTGRRGRQQDVEDLYGLI